MTHGQTQAQRGVSLVEVLIAMVILAVGLLGLVGLQGRLHVVQVEAYQRAQALMLLQDMGNRIVLNRNDAVSYVTVDPLGEGMTCPTTNSTRVEADVRDWCAALQGAAETISSSKLGAMVGGRGCVEDLGGDAYLVTVAWQGLGPVAQPPDSVTCGEGEYDGSDDSPCIDDLCRRVVTTVVRIATL
ncbi:MAG: prepilin-type N-terminal cleavage/methylation domain-containing protein [Steroidobacteraceae bacterium]